MHRPLDNISYWGPIIQQNYDFACISVTLIKTTQLEFVFSYCCAIIHLSVSDRIVGQVSLLIVGQVSLLISTLFCVFPNVIISASDE